MGDDAPKAGIADLEAVQRETAWMTYTGADFRPEEAAEGRRRVLASYEELLEIAEAARFFVDGEGGYGKSPAENIETIYRKHGSEMGYQIVKQGFDRLRETLHPTDPQAGDQP